MGPEPLPNLTLHPVAHHRVAHFARDRNPQLAGLAVPVQGVTHEVRPHGLDALGKNRLELTPVEQPRALRKPMGMRNAQATPAIRCQWIPPDTALHRQALAPLATPGADHRAAVLRGHAGAETMGALTTHIRWLVSALHVLILSSLLTEVKRRPDRGLRVKQAAGAASRYGAEIELEVPYHMTRMGHESTHWRGKGARGIRGFLFNILKKVYIFFIPLC